MKKSVFFKIFSEGGSGNRHIRLKAEYIPKTQIASLKVQNLANQMLFDQQRLEKPQFRTFRNFRVLSVFIDSS